MFFEPHHRILRLKFGAVLTREHLAATDRVLIGFLGGQNDTTGIRGLYDMRDVQVLAVPQRRFADRASRSAIGDMMRIVVAPPWAGDDFGQSYRHAQTKWSHAQPIIVGTLVEAYALLGVVTPRFEPVL